jgi:vancomycin resistance protein YoaR
VSKQRCAISGHSEQNKGSRLTSNLKQDKFISLSSGITSRQKSSRAKPNGLTVLQAITAVSLFPKSNFSLCQFIPDKNSLAGIFFVSFFYINGGLIADSEKPSKAFVARAFRELSKQIS